MKINEIELRNFRAYEGSHVLPLSPVHGNQLTLVFGENWSGKTSLFLALNWCLYGKAFGRQGEEIAIFSAGGEANNYLINASAIENGEYEVYVKLEFEHANKRWVLERKASCEGDPLEGDPFTEDVFLRIDGGVVSKFEIRVQISQVLHHEAAQFYFFDGELLAQYERWLDDPNERETRVRQAVERVVGIAALRLYGELGEVARSAEADHIKVLNRERREEKLVTELSEQLTRLQELQEEIKDYDESIETLRGESERIEREHGELATFVAEQGRLNEIAKQIDAANEDLQMAESQLRALIHDRYWFPLATRVEERHTELLSRLDSALVAPEEELRARLANASLEDRACALCGSELTTASWARLRTAEQDLVLRSFDRLDTVAVQDLSEHLRLCDWFRGAGERERLLGSENARLEARSRLAQLEDDDAEIRNAHANRPRGDREAQMRRLEEVHESLGRARESRQDALEELSAVEDAVASLQRRVNRIQSDPSVQLMARISRLAVDAFKQAIGGFREAARIRVEEHASDVFHALVSDPSYAGVRIDENYRLTTIDPEGRPLPIPSAGGQQILTLALIGGLNAAAVHEAPLVMDTPAGRIDRPNRTRILRWVQTLDRQVILMVHSGELTARDLQDVDIEVGRVFRIRKTGPRSSEIFQTTIEEQLAEESN